MATFPSACLKAQRENIPTLSQRLQRSGLCSDKVLSRKVFRAKKAGKRVERYLRGLRAIPWQALRLLPHVTKTLRLRFAVMFFFFKCPQSWKQSMGLHSDRCTARSPTGCARHILARVSDVIASNCPNPEQLQQPAQIEVQQGAFRCSSVARAAVSAHICSGIPSGVPPTSSSWHFLARRRSSKLRRQWDANAAFDKSEKILIPLGHRCRGHLFSGTSLG